MEVPWKERRPRAAVLLAFNRSCRSLRGVLAIDANSPPPSASCRISAVLLVGLNVLTDCPPRRSGSGERRSGRNAVLLGLRRGGAVSSEFHPERI